jgi:sensor histidine kinase YesM
MEKSLIYTALPMAFNIAACYIHYFWILPLWIKRKKPGLYFLRLLLMLAPLVALRILAENAVFIRLTTDTAYYEGVKIARIVNTVWNTLSFLLFTGMIRFTLDWFDLENRKNQLENEKLVAELNYLKAQINPHFLFNTLHNLNYLVYAKSDKATEVIIKLSNIMRYMIYDANKEKVSLRKEIAYMNDYIDLEGIRLNQAFRINFRTHGAYEQVEIAPLIMLTFLENAFKHGVSDHVEDCWITVDLTVDERLIRYQVSNKKLAPVNRTLRSGFGLDNVKKRLQLSYPGEHALDIADTGETYAVTLTLQRT